MSSRYYYNPRIFWVENEMTQRDKQGFFDNQLKDT